MHPFSRPDQRFPSVRSELTGEKDLHLAGKVLGSGTPGWRLGTDPGTSPEEPGRNDARIVEDQEFVAVKKFRELEKAVIFKAPGRAVELKETRSIAPTERPLGDLVFGQVIVELIESHKARSLAGF